MQQIVPTALRDFFCYQKCFLYILVLAERNRSRPENSGSLLAAIVGSPLVWSTIADHFGAASLSKVMPRQAIPLRSSQQERG